MLITCCLGLWAQARPEDPLPGKYRKWLDEEVVYIISDKERDVFLQLKTDKERDFFIEYFWTARDPDSSTPTNEFKEEHYRRLAYANEHFTTADMPGWKTELGKLYIVLGETWPKPRPGDEPTVKLRLFEGVKDGSLQPPQYLTSSYLSSTISASIESEADIAREQSHLASVFNLKEVKLLTEADINWPEQREGNKIFHMLDFDGKPYLITLSPLGELRKRNFHIVVMQNQPASGDKVVLDTEIVLPNQKTAIFGFQNAQGRPFFLSLFIPRLPEAGGGTGRDSEKVQTPGLSKKGQAEFERGAVRCSELVPPPRLIKSVDAVYPELARQAKVEGIVDLDIRTDTTGRVRDVRVLRSVPLLDQAAVDAVRQWVFEPVNVEGAAVDAIITVGIGFSLKSSPFGSVSTAWLFPGDRIVTGAVKIEGQIPPPKCIKSVPPAYPEIARQAKTEGLVILAIRTDERGRVEAVKVIRSIPLLDQSAVDAIRQWVYEPLVIKGKPRKAAFTVSLQVGPGSPKEIKVNVAKVLQYAPQTDMLFDPMLRSIQDLGYSIRRFERYSRNLSAGYPFITAQKRLSEKDVALNVLVRFVRKTPVTRVEIEVEGIGTSEMNKQIASQALEEIIRKFDEALRIR
jgi:TonB family protein